MPDTMLALVQRNKDGKPTLSKESIPKPIPEAHQVLVKLSHVAQNPTDVQSFDRNAFGDGSVFGCDFSGTVEELGKKVTRLQKGDVIAGLIWGGEVKGLGAYAEYTLADERICFKIPANISPAAASTVPLAAATAWLALLSSGCLDMDRTKPSTILVWGASSSVGLYTAQLAPLLSHPVITTSSPHNVPLLTSLGVPSTHALDHADPDIVAKITQLEPDLPYIFDTIGNETSSALASRCLSRKEGYGGALCTVRPGKTHTEDCVAGTRVSDVLVWTAFLKDHAYGEFRWPANKEDHELSSELFEKLPGWLENGAVKPNVASVKRGLDAVEEGFQEYRDGKISAYKIVYEL